MNRVSKISIIIPVYNVEEYITECLQSVMRQTYKGEMECILVDDCGKDNSIAIAEQLIADYTGPIAFRILHHEHNRGLSAARNTGTDAATGDYIYYLDSDDYISDDCMEVLTDPLKEKEYDMIIGDYFVKGNDWGIPKLCLEEGLYDKEILQKYCTGKIYMMAWNKLYRKSFLNFYELRFKEGILHEDDQMSFKAFASAAMIYIVDRQTYHYLVRENGIMNLKQYSLKNRDGYSETLLTIAGYVLGREKVIQEVHEWLNNRYLKLIVQISNELHISFFDIYKQLRKIYSYPVINQYRESNIKKGKFVMRLHYVLGIHLGYLYLRIFSRYLGYEKI